MTILAPTAENIAISAAELPQRWRALQVYNGYRIVLAMLLLAIHFATEYFSAAKVDQELFVASAGLYWGIGLVSFLLAQKRVPKLAKHIQLFFILDVIALTCIVYASGGVGSGIGILVNIVIISACVLRSSHKSIALAAFASVLLLLQQALTITMTFAEPNSFFYAGVLGLCFFVTAFMGDILLQRVRSSEAIARKSIGDLSSLQQLNDYIIERLGSGIIVINQDWQVRLMNQSAREALNIRGATTNKHVSEISNTLAAKLHDWHLNKNDCAYSYKTYLGDGELLANIVPLGEGHSSGTLIFLDNVTQMSQRAQQMKLASLGRFTASIAHELRNPLGAISHAAQLLNESTSLVEEDKRLVEIVESHCDRMNVVIKNILQLSRRKQSQPELIGFMPWLDNFITEFSAQYQESVVIDYSVEPENIAVMFDKSQLHQIISNLCENGLRYSQQVNNKSRLTITVKTIVSDVIMDVIDYGAGIEDDETDKVFEPFYTKERSGTGLGLYIVKELCEVNHASITAMNTSDAGACFRVVFHEQREEQIL